MISPPTISPTPIQTAESSRPPVARALRWCAGEAMLYLAAVGFGFGAFVLLFQVDAMPGLAVLFYRGLVLLVVALAMTAVAAGWIAARLRAWGVRRRDALSACILSASLNFSFFVLSPVTVDRSLSLFMLGQMAAHSGETYTIERMRSVFQDVYLGEQRQTERRFAEQVLSGNVVRVGEGYAITPQGIAFIQLSAIVAQAFHTDRRLVSGSSAAPVR